MRVALLNDTHFGARSDNTLFYDYFNLFLTKCFFPVLEQRGIKKIIHLGDFFDRRKYINFNTLNWTKQNFLDKTRHLEIDLIIGNHDTYYKNTNSINSPTISLSEYDNIKVYKDPTEVDGILYLPWINSENREATMQAINNTGCKVAMGHLEVAGYVMFKGAVCTSGLSAGLFNKFDSVYTGHFHTKNSSANIHYLGAPWDLIFTDADDVKGFHIYDTETDSLEFVENPYKMYWKFYYDDAGVTDEKLLYLKDAQYRKLINSYVKVYVKSKSSPVLYNKYIQRIIDESPAHLSVLEDYTVTESDVEGSIESTTNTIELIKKSIEDYSDLIPSDEVKQKIESYLTNIYVESLKEQ